MTSQCCGYGAGLSLSANGFDCVMIPGATEKADKADLNNGGAYGFCGGTLATINNMAIAATVCSKLFLTIFLGRKAFIFKIITPRIFLLNIFSCFLFQLCKFLSAFGS